MGGPTLAGGGGIYPGQGGGTYLEQGVPTLTGGRATYPGGGGTYLGQVMPQAVRLLRLPAGGLSC